MGCINIMRQNYENGPTKYTSNSTGPIGDNPRPPKVAKNDMGLLN